MKQSDFNHLQSMRITAKKRFTRDFKEAENVHELLLAYGKYAGNLEAILDTFEILEIERGVKHE